MAKTHTWKVAPAPTGRYRSFTHRGWPTAHYAGKDEPIAAQIYCADPYNPPSVKTGNHAPLALAIADHSVTPWAWRKAKGEYKTVQDAKDAFDRLLNKYPHLAPKA